MFMFMDYYFFLQMSDIASNMIFIWINITHRSDAVVIGIDMVDMDETI